MLNYFTDNLECAREGLIFVCDCSNIGWKNFDIQLEKIGMKLMQDAYPLRIAGFYMLDAPFLLNVLIKICKPFLSKKMQERMFIMSTEEMFKLVPKDQVPSIIKGGEYDDDKLNPFYESCIRYMRRSDIGFLEKVEVEEEKVGKVDEKEDVKDDGVKKDKIDEQVKENVKEEVSEDKEKVIEQEKEKEKVDDGGDGNVKEEVQENEDKDKSVD